MVFMPIILSPIFLRFVHKELRGFSEHIDTVIPLLFVYAPAVAIYLDVRLNRDIRSGYIFYGVAGAMVGFCVALIVVTSFMDSPAFFSNWSVTLSILGLAASLLARLLIHAFSQITKIVG